MNRAIVPQPSLAYTRQPKVAYLIRVGVPSEIIPTFMALSDHSNNKTGLCHPRMDSLARLLGKSVRTVQRHLHLLKDLGLVEFVERRRTRKGKYMSWRYKLRHVALLKKPKSTGHRKHRGSNSKHRPENNAPLNPPKGETKEAREERKATGAARRLAQMREIGWDV